MVPATFLSAMNTNVVGPALVYQAFLPMLERSLRPEGPVVLNTSSTFGSIGLDLGMNGTTYSITKTALNMLVRNIRFSRVENSTCSSRVWHRRTNNRRRSRI